MSTLTARAEALHDEGNFIEAEKLFEKVLAEDPTHPGKMFNLAKALHRQGKLRQAVDLYCDIMISPGDFPVYKANAANNLGLVLVMMEKPDEAITALRFALSLIPNFAPAMNNLANVLRYQGKTEEALQNYLKAIEDDGSCWDARMNCGTIQLLTGDFTRGWENHEHRFKSSGWMTRPINDPRRWNGESLTGKTLLLSGEQGVGDAIMGIRYAPMIRERFGPDAIHYHGHRETVELFGHVKGGLDKITCEADPNDISRDSYDFHCPLFSLPRIFGTTLDSIPNSTYIDITERPDTPTTSNLRVGIVWAGNPGHKRDKFRSVTPEILAPLAEVDGVDWVSLQVGTDATSCPAWAEDYSPKLSSYVDTAYALNGLDLLISVDTSIVHLAGAIGRPVWMLTPANPDWRWMLTRTDSPWYPQMQLFRQETEGDWSGVVQDIKTKLKERIDHP